MNGCINLQPACRICCSAEKWPVQKEKGMISIVSGLSRANKARKSIIDEDVTLTLASPRTAPASIAFCMFNFFVFYYNRLLLYSD